MQADIIVFMAVAMIVFVILAVVAVITFGVYRIYKCLKNLELQLSKFNESIGVVPPLLEGVSNICSSLTASALKMNGSVDNFQKSIFSQQSESGRKLNPYSDENASRSWDIQEVMRDRGVSREQAEAFVSSGMVEDEGTFRVF